MHVETCCLTPHSRDAKPVHARDMEHAHAAPREVRAPSHPNESPKNGTILDPNAPPKQNKDTTVTNNPNDEHRRMQLPTCGPCDTYRGWTSLHEHVSAVPLPRSPSCSNVFPQYLPKTVTMVLDLFAKCQAGGADLLAKTRRYEQETTDLPCLIAKTHLPLIAFL